MLKIDNPNMQKIYDLWLSNDLENIISERDKFNIFNVLKLNNAEIRHSNFLAWLMTPRESHNIVDYFLKAFLEFSIKDFINDSRIKIDPIDILGVTYYDCEIRREYCNIDILIINPDNKFVCVIENKIWSGEHSQQLERYAQIINNEFKGYKKLYLFLTPQMAGTVLSAYTITQIFNNRTNQSSSTYHEAKIKEAITGREIILKFGYDDLANDKSFKAKINTLSSFKNDEYTEFVSKYVKKNNPIYIEECTNAGRVFMPESNLTDNIPTIINWTWRNAAYHNGEIYFEDENHNIKISDEKYIRVARNSRRLLPRYVVNSKPIKEVIKELFKNIYESWNGALEPFLALAFMSLSAYCPEFWRKEGFGSLAFVGDTEAGKTEITALALGIYGFDKSFMGTTRNTLVGVEQKMNNINCTPVIIDDISKFKMSGETFADELKRLMNGMAREKGKNGQESGTLPPCCPFGFSTNHLPNEKPEIMNRLLYLDTENLTFNPKKFNYFGKGVEDLSCILPHILDIGFEKVNQLHTDRKNWLLENFTGISDRMASQIAIAIAGLDVFNQIAKTDLPIPWDKFGEYINTCIQRFETAKSPLDKLLEAFPIM